MLTIIKLLKAQSDIQNFKVRWSSIIEGLRKLKGASQVTNSKSQTCYSWIVKKISHY